MSNLIMARMLFPVQSVLGGSNPGALMTPDPKEVNSTGAAGTINLDVDLGAPFKADTFFLGFISSNITAVSLQSATGLGTGLSASLGNFWLGSQAAKRRHALLRLAAPVTSQYWRVGVTSSGPLTAGILGIGCAIQPTWGHEWGAGRQPLDSAVVTPLRGGGFAVEPGAIKGAWSYTLGDLTDNDLRSLWNLTQDIGIGYPLLVVEDPDPLTGVTVDAPVIPSGIGAGTVIVTQPGSVGAATVRKSAGADGYNASARSTMPLDGNFVMRLKHVSNGNTANAYMAGVNSDPLTDDIYSSIDFGWLRGETGNFWAIYEAGNLVANNFPDLGYCWIWRQGDQLNYGRGATFAAAQAAIDRTVTYNGPLYFDSSLYSVNDSFEAWTWRGDPTEGLHYGLLDKPEVYERQPGGHRWSFRVEEWV